MKQILLVIKIQAHWRGTLARKKIYELKANGMGRGLGGTFG